MDFPEEYLYAKDHLWYKTAGDAALIGITAHAQEELGDIVYADLPAAGAQVAAGQAFGSLESVKAISDLFAPVSGSVLEVNPRLEAEPQLLNQSPYEDGWLVKVTAADAGEVAALMNAAAYREAIGK